MLNCRDNASVSLKSSQVISPKDASVTIPSLTIRSLLQLLRSDWQTVKDRNPSVQNWLEMLFCYPGLHAIALHRGAHWLYRLKIPFLPRLISTFNRFLTGIDIHPDATIGEGVFIAHGAGVVIGETAIVGDGTLIYQGVTLGGTGKEKGKRHPTLGKNVVVGPGAKVLGNIQIGDRVCISTESVVLRDVPDNSIAIGIPGRTIHLAAGAEFGLSREFQPDLEAQVIQNLFERIKKLEATVESLKSSFNPTAVDTEIDKVGDINNESDSIVEDFLDGAGI